VGRNWYGSRFNFVTWFCSPQLLWNPLEAAGIFAAAQDFYQRGKKQQCEVSPIRSCFKECWLSTSVGSFQCPARVVLASKAGI
jgi:hypothetical protein